MKKGKPAFVGVDLFAGAGGLSLGAKLADINVVIAVEKDKSAVETYSYNHPETQIINDDIQKIQSLPIKKTKAQTVLFGGPPCQGFSSSNQRTRNQKNPSNWLLTEFVRITDLLGPDWIVFENVCGFISTEGKLFLNLLLDSFESRGYSCVWYVLNATDYGVPQKRSRFFLVGSRHGVKVGKPVPLHKGNPITVYDAIGDLPCLTNGAKTNYLAYKTEAISDYSYILRNNLNLCSGHIVTQNSAQVIERYKYIPQGGNWQDIPEALMDNYTDRTRCHAGIYYRLKQDEPSLTIGNYRKAMLVHPWENRGLSVREAARIQSFPDSYEFKGSLGFQQQQVGNAVPPMLAKSVFDMITNEGYGI
ncbi:MAG: DNA cytosine methyltransferase [Methanobacterium sp.]